MKLAPVRGRHRGFGSTAFGQNLNTGYFNGTPCFTNPSYSGSFFCRQFIPRHRPFFTGVLLFPYFGYPAIDYSSEEETPAAIPEDNSLASQVKLLKNEVERMRDELISRENQRSGTVAPQAATVETPVPTMIAYRDGHKFEVQNYAILGQTLWIFGDQTTRKIPLADLDLNLTRKLNDERGVDFTLPKSR